MSVKFTQGSSYEDWKKRLLAEVSTMPFGRYLMNLETPQNPRKPFTQHYLFYGSYGTRVLIKLCADLEFAVKDLISRIIKLGYTVLHQSICENVECMALITSLTSINYFEAFQLLERRFAPFQDSEKEKLQSDWYSMSIQHNQSFRNFWGKSQEIVHKLSQHHHVVIDDNWLYHKLRTNLNATLRTYYYTIRNEFLSCCAAIPAFS